MVWFIWSVVYSVNCLLTFFICTSNTSFSISACNNLQFKYYMFSQTEILIISSWNHRSLWLAAHSGLAPSLIDHKGSITLHDILNLEIIPVLLLPNQSFYNCPAFLYFWISHFYPLTHFVFCFSDIHLVRFYSVL